MRPVLMRPVLRRTVSSALVVASGAPLSAVQHAPQTDLVIAADAGLEVLLQAGRPIDLVVGDLDSVSAAALSEATEGGTEIQQHRRDKDESDLELALAAAITSGARRIHVLLRDGGRLDHQLANLLVLASTRWRQAQLDAVVGEHRVWVVRGGDQRTIPLVEGEALALQAVGATAEGVTTTGLRYPLTGADLPTLVALGISNRAVVDAPTIRVESGVVIAINSSTPSNGGSAVR